MRRDVIVSVDSCYSCPHFTQLDGYDEHAYYCPLLGRTSSTVTANSETWDEVHVILMDWFTKYCPLPLTKEQ